MRSDAAATILFDLLLMEVTFKSGVNQLVLIDQKLMGNDHELNCKLCVWQPFVMNKEREREKLKIWIGN